MCGGATHYIYILNYILFFINSKIYLLIIYIKYVIIYKKGYYKSETNINNIIIWGAENEMHIV